MTEDRLELETLSWLVEVGYSHLYGPDIAPDGNRPERATYREVVLARRLRHAVDTLNPNVPVMQEPLMENPTIVVITDRNDLDGQLFGVFSLAQDLLRERPVQAGTRQELRALLENRPSGGIVFATIQKFMPGEDEDVFPMLSSRRNIVVIADEAHRTQYGFEAKLKTVRARPMKSERVGSDAHSANSADFASPAANVDRYQVGYAQHLRDALPHATFVAFTGTPVSGEDRDTRAVFGDYISVYDMQQAKEDGATVAIYYESRLAKLGLKADELATIDDEVDELAEDEEEIRQIIGSAVVSEEVVDIFNAVGLDKPNIGILDDAFLAEVRNLPERNLAVELLERLLEGEIKTRFASNVVQNKKFSDMLTDVVQRYQNRSIEAAQVMDELVEMAKTFRAAAGRGQELGLTEDEVRFYDALVDNESAVRDLTDETLKKIAHELAENLRRNLTVDWSARESVQAKLRLMVKRILRKYR